MSIEGIHPSKLFTAPFTRKRSIVRMQLFVPFTIVLSSKSLPAARPMTLEWLFFVMGSYMSYQRLSVKFIVDKINDTPPLRLKLLVKVLPHP